MAGAADLRRNRILATLSAPVLERLSALAMVRETSRGEVSYHPGEPMDHVTFPLSGLYSLVVTDSFGSFTSIATVGREGAVELAPALGSVPAPTEVVCLLAGEIAQIPTHELAQLIDEIPAFRSSIYRYLGARFVDCVQVSACHRLHPLEARMARCLLTTRDRIERDEFPCTHELLAGMLGASRPKVSLAIAALQKAGALIHRRGSVEIVDPAALESLTCGCYRTIRNAFQSVPAAGA